tara:strand:- start:2347 stop:3516 length:1170 start_codon:yes stop_codon:yes gene_type:complete
MIRNYFTDSFKGGVVPVVSTTQLIDGTTKIAYSTASNDNNASTTTSLVLKAKNQDIEVGMLVSGAGVPAINTANFPCLIERIIPGQTFSSDNQDTAVNTAITLTAGGSGYTGATAVATTSNGAGTGMTITTTVVAGAVTVGVIVNSGKGYAIGDIVTIAGGGGDATFTISATTSLVLTTANANIQQGMTLEAVGIPSGTSVTEVINSNTFVLSAALVIPLNTPITYDSEGLNFTLNTAVNVGNNVALTYAVINQGYWKEYNLYIGTTPASFTIQNNVAVTGGQTLTLNTPDPRIQVGMTVGGIGIPAGVTVTVINADGITLTVAGSAIGTLGANALLTYSFSVLPSITVTTIDNNQLTFSNPAQGFVLPVSVVQVNSVAGGLTNLLALD